jgi:hypothetical protein
MSIPVCAGSGLFIKNLSNQLIAKLAWGIRNYCAKQLGRVVLTQ